MIANLIFGGYFLVCYIISASSTFTPTQECTVKPYFNTLVLEFCGIILVWNLMKLAFHYILTGKRKLCFSDYVNHYYFIDGAMYLVAFPLWFYLNIAVWYEPFNKTCLTGVVIMDFVNLILIYLYVSSYVIGATFFVPCGLVISLFWIKGLYDKRKIQKNSHY